MRGEIKAGLTMEEPIATQGDWEQLAREDVETMLDLGGVLTFLRHDEKTSTKLYELIQTFVNSC